MLPRKQYNFGQQTSRTKQLEKKIPENPRYKNVKPVVNTGNTVKRYIDNLKESHRSAHLRMDEVFSRIKLSAFVRLVIEFYKNVQEVSGDSMSVASTAGIFGDAGKNGQSEEKVATTTSYHSVLVGFGEMDLQTKPNKSEEFSDKVVFLPPPYLLLDVRCREEYEQCHIITAKNYPYTMLSRSPGYETKDLLQYKNLSSRIIILYDEDESISMRVARTLVQRGYDNIFLLTGGLKQAHEKFPVGLISGNRPLTRNCKLPKDRSVSSSPSAASIYPHVDNFSEDDIFKLQGAMDLYVSSATASRASSSRDFKPGTEERQAIKRLEAPARGKQPWK